MLETNCKPTETGDAIVYDIELPPEHRCFYFSLATLLYIKAQKNGFLSEEELLEIAETFGMEKSELDNAIRQISRIHLNFKTSKVKCGVISEEGFNFIGAIYSKNDYIVQVNISDTLDTKTKEEKIITALLEGGI